MGLCRAPLETRYLTIAAAASPPKVTVPVKRTGLTNKPRVLEGFADPSDLLLVRAPTSLLLDIVARRHWGSVCEKYREDDAKELSI